jgi:predicted amidohydrolase YtcJ
MEITLLLTHGKIYTMDGRIFEAMAVSKDRIVKLGNNASIKSMGGPGTLKLDLKGKTVLPGFNDSHLHLQIHGANRNSADLRNVISIKELVETARRFMIRTGKMPGDWIYGWGWDQNILAEKTFPTKDDLDRISSENPVVILRACHHIGVMNTAAIRWVGATNGTSVPGGVFDRDRNGNINGVFREAAIGWVFDRIPAKSVDQIKADLEAGIREAVSFGVTSLQTSDLHDGIRFDEMVAAYSELREEGKLLTRINAQLYLPDRMVMLDFLKKRFRPFEGDNLFRLGPVKLLLDGSLGARTAALKEAYSDDPGNRGHLTYSREELFELVSLAHQHGMQLALHAIGDAAVEAGVDAVERAVKENPREHRHRIIHAQITNHDLLGRMAELRIMADIQPVFVSSDWNLVESRIGKERAKASYAWKSMLNEGIPMAAGTDAPVEDLNPMYGIYAAVTRKDRQGQPPGGWLPKQKLTVYEAVKLYTKGGAYATFEENDKGTLGEGKLADMAILSEDPFEAKPEDIKDIEVLTTILGGEIVYTSSPACQIK